MKSALAICLLVTLLCGVGARDILGSNGHTSCATYNFNGPKIVNECPCSGKGKQCHKEFDGNWKMDKFRLDDNNQIWCDGYVTGSWGHKKHQNCKDIFVSVPVKLEKCGNKRFRSPGGKCSDWCKPKDGHNSGPHCGEICNVPTFLGCTVESLFPSDNSRRMLLGNDGEKKQCGYEKCDVISLFLGPVDVDVGCGCDIELEQVEIIIGGYDHGVLDELICVVGHLLDTGCDPDWLVKLLNIWLGGCNSPSECGILGDVNVSVGEIVSKLGLPPPN